MKLFICTLLAAVVCHVGGQGLPTGSPLGVVTNGLGGGAQPLASGQPDLSNLKPPSISDLLNAPPLNIVTGGEPTNCNDGPPACGSLTPAKVNYQTLIERSPFYVTQANMVAFNCTQAVYVGPSANRHDYTGTVVAIQLGATFSFQVDLINRSIFRTLFCATGFKGDYKTIYSKFTLHRSVFCVANCADDGIGYNALYCAGRTPEDSADAQSFLDTKLAGVPGIVNTQSGCPQPQFCDFFNY